MKYLLTAFVLIVMAVPAVAKETPHLIFVDTIKVEGEFETRGIYYPELNIILMKRGMEDDYASKVWTHEMGHFEWFNRTQSYRDRYCKLIDLRNYVPTEYGKTSCEENFAEAMVMYDTYGELSDPVVERWLKRAYDDLVTKLENDNS
jgi:hypothetical protein